MVIALVQCRLGSTRFPRKALALLNGQPVIVHVVERALKIRGVDRVIVVTPWGDALPIAQALADIGITSNNGERRETHYVGDRLSVFQARVDDDDVLGRCAEAVRNYPDCDTVMRLTGDCPILQPGVCERVLALYRESQGHYAWTDTHAGDWPDGLDCEVFSCWSLHVAHAKATDPVDREHVTRWIRANVPQIAELEPDEAYDHWPKVSIDTAFDLKRVETFIA